MYAENRFKRKTSDTSDGTKWNFRIETFWYDQIHIELIRESHIQNNKTANSRIENN